MTTNETPPQDGEARAELIARIKDLLRGEDGAEYTDAGMEDTFFRWPAIERALLAAAPVHPNAQTDGEGRFREAAIVAEAALSGMIRLSEMGFEASMREPEENGNYAAYNRALEALALVRAAVADDSATLPPQGQPDTIAFVQEWMMSGDHEADQWHRDFAAAIDARRSAGAIEVDLTAFANRFCAAPLPASVCADPCASMPEYQFPRSGTNLLTVAEAKEVLRFVLAPKQPVDQGQPKPVEAGEELQRGVAQFFFEIGFGACFAHALIQNGMNPPFEFTDALVEHAWEIAGEVHEDPEEFDRYLALADGIPTPATTEAGGLANSPPDEDWLADVIDDSLDMDWTGRIGARAIIAAWDKRHGH